MCVWEPNRVTVEEKQGIYAQDDHEERGGEDLREKRHYMLVSNLLQYVVHVQLRGKAFSDSRCAICSRHDARSFNTDIIP